MNDPVPIAPYLAPLEKTLLVKCPPAHAFEVFTRGFGAWWPLARGFCVGGARAAGCTFEERADGAIYETDADGKAVPWGRVLAWDPPARVVFTWHPGRDAAGAQEVEVRFAAEGDGTRVTLVHRDWQKLGDAAARSRAGYDEGWGVVLGEHFAPACA